MMTAPCAVRANQATASPRRRNGRRLGQTKKSGSLRNFQSSPRRSPLKKNAFSKSISNFNAEKERRALENSLLSSPIGVGKKTKETVSPSLVKPPFEGYNISTRFSGTLSELMQSVADLADEDSGLTEAERKSLRTDVRRLSELRQEVESPSGRKSPGQSTGDQRFTTPKSTKDSITSSPAKYVNVLSISPLHGEETQPTGRSSAQAFSRAASERVFGSSGKQDKSTSSARSRKSSSGSGDIHVSPQRSRRQKSPSKRRLYARSSSERLVSRTSGEGDSVFADINPRSPKERKNKVDGEQSSSLHSGLRSPRKTKAQKEFHIDLSPRASVTPSPRARKQKLLTNQYARAASERQFSKFSTPLASGKAPEKKQNLALPRIPRSPRKIQKDAVKRVFARASSESRMKTTAPDSPKAVRFSDDRPLQSSTEIALPAIDRSPLKRKEANKDGKENMEIDVVKEIKVVPLSDEPKGTDTRANNLPQQFSRAASARCFGSAEPREFTVMSDHPRAETGLRANQDDPRDLQEAGTRTLDLHFGRVASARCLNSGEAPEGKTPTTYLVPMKKSQSLRNVVGNRQKRETDDDLSMADTIESSAHMENVDALPMVRSRTKPTNARGFARQLSARVLRARKSRFNGGRPPKASTLRGRPAPKQKTQLKALSTLPGLKYEQDSSRDLSPQIPTRCGSVCDEPSLSEPSGVSECTGKASGARDILPQRPTRYGSIAGGSSVDVNPSSRSNDVENQSEVKDVSPQRPMRCVSMANGQPVDGVENVEVEPKSRDFSPQRPRRRPTSAA